MDFFEALLALLGSGSTSDCSHVDYVVLLAAWPHATLDEDEGVGMLPRFLDSYCQNLGIAICNRELFPHCRRSWSESPGENQLFRLSII